MALEGAVDVILALAVRRIFTLRFPLEDDHTATLVACGQQLSGMVELNSKMISASVT